MLNVKFTFTDGTTYDSNGYYRLEDVVRNIDAGNLDKEFGERKIASMHIVFTQPERGL